MLSYYRCSREELIRFAESRQLRLSLSKSLFCRPTKPNLIQALKQADIAWTFRFLDLSPELRTWVYRELLVLQNSYKCHPAILATCRQISNEATNILYGDNLLQIRICYDGVFAHGKKCGSYEPRPYLRPRSKQNTRLLVWPDYLRRVQFLKIEYLSLEIAPVSSEIPRVATVHNILYSLCSFLFDNHRLRSLELDLQKLTATLATKSSLHAVEKSIRTTVYPLRLLGELKRLQIEGLPARFVNLLEPTPLTLQLADEVLTKPIWRLMKHDQVAFTTKYELADIASINRYPGNTHTTPEAVLLLLQSLGMGRVVLSLPTLLVQSATNTKLGGAMVRQFLQHVEDIRQLWGIARPQDVTGALMKRIDGLVRLDVELKLAVIRQ